jgi:predicted ATPase
MLVSGEAGIGKSALLRRFAEGHAADARFLLGACDPLLTPGPWGRCMIWPARRVAGWPRC